jgi:hypothetical protein
VGLALAALALTLVGLGVAIHFAIASPEGRAQPADDGLAVGSEPFPVPEAPVEKAPVPAAAAKSAKEEPATAPPKKPAEPAAGAAKEENAPPHPRPAPARKVRDKSAPAATAPHALRQAPLAKQKLINQAIDRGVRWLKQQQHANGRWGDLPQFDVGYASLAGLTLLECGVPRDDVSVQKAARLVRASIPKLQIKTNYQVSLAILFLDRLGEKRDEPLIVNLAARLIAGQYEGGGWGYECPVFTAPETNQLLTFLRQQSPRVLPNPIRPGDGPGPNPLAAGKPAPLPTGILPGSPANLPGGLAGDKTPSLPTGIQGPRRSQSSSDKKTANSDSSVIQGPPTEPTSPGKDRPTSHEAGVKPERKPRNAGKKEPLLRPDKLLPAIRHLPVITGKPFPATMRTARRPLSRPDNSNSQFALLALWAARRHDVPIERTMRLVLRRYHSSQLGDGGWSYLNAADRIPPKERMMTRPFESRPSMDCVGLLGLGMAHGCAQEIAAARAANNKEKGAALRLGQEDPAIRRGLLALGQFIGQPTGAKVVRLENLFFLWSVERTAVLYNLKTIGGKDWYGWEADMLLVNQQGDGHWESSQLYRGGFNPLVETCLALLILKRVNLVQDLTDNLRDYLPITDPGLSSSPGSRK